MRNKFAGRCVHCNCQVDKGKGHFQRSSKDNEAIGVKNFKGKWLIRCVECVDRIRKEKELER